MTRVYLDPATNRLVMCVPFERRTRQGRVELRTATSEKPVIKWEPQRTLVLALARAQLWQDQLDNGKFKSVGELSARLGFKDSSYVSRTLNLALLDWDIKELILDGKEPPGMSLSKLAQAIPLDWDEQRVMFGLAPRLTRQAQPAPMSEEEDDEDVPPEPNDTACEAATYSSIPDESRSATPTVNKHPSLKHPHPPAKPASDSGHRTQSLFKDFDG
jgi:hypothetical protein